MMKKYTRKTQAKNFEIDDDVDRFLYKFITGEDI